MSRAVIVAKRADDPERAPVPGDPYPCARCGVTCLLSPTTLSHPALEGRVIEIVCLECVQEDPEDMILAPPSEAQQAEGGSFPYENLYGKVITWKKPTGS